MADKEQSGDFYYYAEKLSHKMFNPERRKKEKVGRQRKAIICDAGVKALCWDVRNPLSSFLHRILYVKC